MAHHVHEDFGLGGCSAGYFDESFLRGQGSMSVLDEATMLIREGRWLVRLFFGGCLLLGRLMCIEQWRLALTLVGSTPESGARGSSTPVADGPNKLVH